VLEYRVSETDPEKVDMSTARPIFELEQPFSNHNGGYLQFGPDGKLYVGTGDGGAAGDPLGAGQDDKNLLAKMLRFDVDAEDPRPDIVSKGLRNPWRYDFDSKTGDLYIADVGQNKYEFIYVVAADDLYGHNFGWNVVEGNRCFKSKSCEQSGFTPAVIEYDHGTGCSITGGVVYRGKAIPELDGAYFYADYCTAILRSFRWTRDGVRQHWSWNTALDPKKRLREISAFGTDKDGELYILSLQGDIYKLVRN
jgi:glucose/arabinose dehydrogenase